MRMNYKTYPTDYVQELKQIKNNRKKARCFHEYYDDMEHQDHNSYGFYAESWSVSKSTVYDWINEFKKEIALFIDHWHLRNSQHYSYAKNQAERLPNDNTLHQAQDIGIVDNTAERLPNEALNYINNNNQSGFLFDKNYIDFYFVYSRNTNYPGNKPNAYQSFANCNVNVDLLKLAAMRYLHDKAVDKPVGVKKFLENEMYIPYLPKYMKVKSGDGNWYEGIYDDKTFEFKKQDGTALGTIEPSLLIELFEKKELVYLQELEEKLHA